MGYGMKLIPSIAVGTLLLVMAASAGVRPNVLADGRVEVPAGSTATSSASYNTTNSFLNLADSTASYLSSNSVFTIQPHTTNTAEFGGTVGGHLYNTTSNRFYCVEAGTYMVVASFHWQVPSATKIFNAYIVKNCTANDPTSSPSVPMGLCQTYNASSGSRLTMTVAGLATLAVGDNISTWTWADADTTCYGSSKNGLAIFRIY